MKRSVIVSGVAAGFLLVSPALAFATTPTGGTPVPTGGTPIPVSTPGSPVTGYTSTPADRPSRITRKLTLLPAKAHPGDLVKLDFVCTGLPDGGVSEQSIALDFDHVVPQDHLVTGRVTDVKPGKYPVVVRCGTETTSATLEVLPKKAKQVEKVPAGAPQTGGTDGPIGGGPDGVAMAAGAMGVLAVGGAGLVALRRRRAE